MIAGSYIVRGLAMYDLTMVSTRAMSLSVVRPMKIAISLMRDLPTG